MRIPFHNGDEHKKQAYRTYERKDGKLVVFDFPQEGQNGFNERNELNFPHSEDNIHHQREKNHL